MYLRLNVKKPQIQRGSSIAAVSTAKPFVHFAAICFHPYCVLCAALIAVAGASPPTAAADRVTIRPEDSTGLLVITGDIQDYNDVQLTLRVGGAPAQSYPRSVIAAVTTFRTPAHVRGLELYEQGQLAEAVAQFELALDAEQRKWMRHEVLAGLVQAHQRRGEFDAAVRRFVEIAAEEPHSRHWEIAPLHWMPSTVSEPLQVDARRWAAAPSEAVRLVGASVCLGNSATRLTGVAELHKLARAQDRYIAPLAQALLWGATLDSNVTSVEELNRWQRDIERMPESIRGGPWYALGQARLRRNEPEEAAAALLRVLIVHDADELLAARAGLEAGLALRRINRDDESQQVLAEVIERFPWTPSAREALGELAK